jgi:transposase
VISSGARRRWTLEEKQRIVAESYAGSRLVSATARRYGLSASQLLRGDDRPWMGVWWMRQ